MCKKIDISDFKSKILFNNLKFIKMVITSYSITTISGVALNLTFKMLLPIPLVTIIVLPVSLNFPQANLLPYFDGTNRAP